MHDTAIEELEQENRLLRARNDRLEKELQHEFRQRAKDIAAAEQVIMRRAIERLEQGGQGAGASILRHHFFGATNG